MRQWVFLVAVLGTVNGMAFGYNWKTYGVHRYALTSHGTWAEAEGEAIAAGGHLVAVNDEADAHTNFLGAIGKWNDHGNFLRDMKAIIEAPLVPIPGDADIDGDVDDDDLSLVPANWTGPFGIGKAWWQGDFEGDGDVADDDLSMLLANWTGSPDSIGIPEPATVSRLAVGVAVLARRQRMRSKLNGASR